MALGNVSGPAVSAGETPRASAGRSLTSHHRSGGATTKGNAPSTKKSTRQSEQDRIHPDNGAVMIEEIAMFIIQTP